MRREKGNYKYIEDIKLKKSRYIESISSRIFEVMLIILGMLVLCTLIAVQSYGHFMDDRILMKHESEGRQIQKVEYLFPHDSLYFSFLGKQTESMPIILINGEYSATLNDLADLIIEVKENDYIEVDCSRYEGSGYLRISQDVQKENKTLRGQLNTNTMNRTFFLKAGSKFVIGKVFSIHP